MGLPTVVGRNKRASLNYIKDRVWENFDASMYDDSKLQVWNHGCTFRKTQ